MKNVNYKLNAEIKTISDYALILEHCNGYTKDEARKAADQSAGETLFDLLLERNIELFRTGDVVMF